MGNNNNKPEVPYVKLKNNDVQNFIDLIKKNLNSTPFINHKFKILHENDYVLFPIVKNQVLQDKVTRIIDKQINLEFVSKEGQRNEYYKYRTLREALEGKFPNKYLDLIPKSYDIIGHIVIIEFERFNHIKGKEFNNYKKEVAKAILLMNKNVKTVYEKKSQIKGKYRLRKLALLYGEDKSETIHKENGCNFKLDIKKTYFSPRLVFERRRIASSEIRENDLIVDMFAGVGTFAIQIAKNKSVKIYTFDVNPDAYRYIKENMNLNKLKGEIIPYNLDVRDLLKPANQIGQSLSHKIDRIIMNLPENSIEFIREACFLMKKAGGILHFYQFSEKPKPIEKTLKILEKNLSNLNWEIENLINSKIVKHYSPRSDLIVVDLKLKSINQS